MWVEFSMVYKVPVCIFYLMPFAKLSATHDHQCIFIDYHIALESTMCDYTWMQKILRKSTKITKENEGKFSVVQF